MGGIYPSNISMQTGRLDVFRPVLLAAAHVLAAAEPISILGVDMAAPESDSRAILEAHERLWAIINALAGKDPQVCRAYMNEDDTLVELFCCSGETFGLPDVDGLNTWIRGLSCRTLAGWKMRLLSQLGGTLDGFDDSGEDDWEQQRIGLIRHACRMIDICLQNGTDLFVYHSNPT